MLRIEEGKMSVGSSEMSRRLMSFLLSMGSAIAGYVRLREHGIAESFLHYSTEGSSMRAITPGSAKPDVNREGLIR